MIRKIHLNTALYSVPLNGLIRLDGVFYRRGHANRSTKEIQLVLAEGFNEISFVPRNSIVQYYIEYGK